MIFLVVSFIRYYPYLNIYFHEKENNNLIFNNLEITTFEKSTSEMDF